MNSNVRTRVLVISLEPAGGAGVSRDVAGGPEAVAKGRPTADQLCAGPPSFQLAWGLTENLSGIYDVILAVPEKTLLSHPDFAVVYYNRRNIGLLANDSEIVICDERVAEAYPFLTEDVVPATVSPGALKDASLEAVLDNRDAAGLPAPGPGEPALLVWRPPAAEPHKGLKYYLKRLRLHLKRGGARGAASQGGSLIKRKISGKG